MLPMDEPLAALGNLTIREIEARGIHGLDEVWNMVEEEIERKYLETLPRRVKMTDEGEEEEEEDDDEDEEGVINEKMLATLPAKDRELLEAQLEDAAAEEEVTSYRDKYPQVYDNEVNMTTLEDQLPAQESDRIVGLAALLQELGANKTQTSGAGVGLKFSCKAPHYTCVVTEVTPMLSAWDASISAGDVLHAIGNTTVKALIEEVMANVNTSLRASRKGADDIQLMLDIAKGRQDSIFINESNALVHKAIHHALHGARGSVLNVTVRKTFRYIQKLTKKRAFRHAKYDGKAVLLSFNLTRSEKEDLPPNWEHVVRYCWVDKAGFRKQRTLEELRLAGAISEEEFDAGIAALPDAFAKVLDEDADDSFKQAFICYHNRVSGCYSLVRPKQDPPIEGPSAQRLRRYAADLWHAAAGGEAHKLGSLHVRGADLNWRNPDWRLAAPLHKAAQLGHVAVLDKLLSLGADPFITNELGWTALHYACFSDQLPIAQRLLDHGLDPNTRDAAGWTPLHQAAVKGSYRCMGELVARGADKGALNNHGFSPCEMVVVLDTLKTHKIDRQAKCLEALAPLPASTRTRDQLERDGLLVV